MAPSVPVHSQPSGTQQPQGGQEHARAHSKHGGRTGLCLLHYLLLRQGADMQAELQAGNTLTLSHTIGHTAESVAALILAAGCGQYDVRHQRRQEYTRAHSRNGGCTGLGLLRRLLRRLRLLLLRRLLLLLRRLLLRRLLLLLLLRRLLLLLLRRLLLLLPRPEPESVLSCACKRYSDQASRKEPAIPWVAVIAYHIFRLFP